MDDLSKYIIVRSKDIQVIARYAADSTGKSVLAQVTKKAGSDGTVAKLGGLHVAGDEDERLQAGAYIFTPTAAGQAEEYNTSLPFNSPCLTKTLNMHAPYVQYGMYVSAASAFIVALWQVRKGVRAVGRARQLGRAAYLKDQGRPRDEWLNVLAEADATELQLRKVSNFISRQTAIAASSCINNHHHYNFVVAVATPLLWLSYVGYRWMSVPRESQQAQLSKDRQEVKYEHANRLWESH